MFNRRDVSIGSHDKTDPSTSLRDGWRLVIVASFLAIASLSFLAPQSGYANGPNVENNVDCMQTLYGKKLNCSANDISLAAVKDIVVLDDGCAFPGDTVTFTANFELLLTAQERHDIGLFLSEDGTDALIGEGTCTAATPLYDPDPPWLDLDGTNDDPDGLIQDTCGDIDASHNPLAPEITLTVVCVDLNHDEKLDLSNCSSWRQPGANELCISPTEAIPGAPSKCRCGTITVDIDVPPATIDVVKTARTNPVTTPPSVDEPGGPVTFDVEITNNGIDPENPLDLNSCIDNQFGDLFDAANPLLSDNSCLTMIKVVGEGDTVTCHFTADVNGNALDSPHNDIVTCSGTDQRVPPNQLTGSDDADVLILDVDPDISVEKEVTPASLPEPGGVFTFTVTVTNDSDAENVTLNSLIDNVYGDLTAATDTTCSVPQTLTKSGGWYSCGFTGEFLGIPGATETDTVTAVATDDEGNEDTATANATVLITNVPSSITVDKTANPTNVDEPGANVTFTVTVTNTSTTDVVTITSLIDSIHGDLTVANETTCSLPQDLAADGGSFSCSFVALVEGNAGDTETDVVTASGVDDDENYPEDALDSATVTIDDVDPAAHLTKTVTKMVVTYVVEVFNDSAVEAVDVDALVDDKFGDLFTLVGVSVNDCNLLDGASIPVGESVSCTFDAEVDTTPHTNTVTGTVSDDDGDEPGNVVTPSPEASATVTFDPPTPPAP